MRAKMKAFSSTRQALVGHQMAFMTIIGFWVFHALIVSLRAAVVDLPEQGELVWRRIVVMGVGIFLTWLLYLALRQFDRRQLNVRVATAFLLAVPCAIAIAWANFYIFNIYDPISMFEDPTIQQQVEDLRRQTGYDVWQEIGEIAITRYFFIIAWSSLYLALGYAREVREAERAASRFAQAAQDSELRSLRYQVNPHFLFNTLNSLSSLVITGQNGKAEAMIQNLSSFYRNSLSSDPLEDVTLAEEVEMQKLYLDIETVRYPERLRTVIDIPAAVERITLPEMILQPLVENAVKYGVSRSHRPVTVTIRARGLSNGVEITIHDDGQAIPHERDGAVSSSGIGLTNVRDRLEARYGAHARLETVHHDGGGFSAILTIADGKPHD
jgi:two-component system, LytTR family, sensor kinase